MKNRRWLVLALALCLALSFTGCYLKPAATLPELVRGSGNVVETKTPLAGDAGGFTLRIKGISLRGSTTEVELAIDESLAREVVVTADDNIAECISVDYNAAAGEIVVDLNRRVAFSPSELRIAVGAPVTTLDINGAWRFTYNCPGVKSCRASINGAANGTFTFGTLDSLQVDVNGASEIKLTGAAKQAELTVNGAANIRAFDLTAENAGVTINGTGSCDITATGTLDAEINGLGKVVYGGEPVVSKRVHGLGEVRAR